MVPVKRSCTNTIGSRERERERESEQTKGKRCECKVFENGF